MSDDKRLSILHIIVSAGHTNGQYNEHCLPVAQERDITICTLLRCPEAPPDCITLFEGDGSLGGFIRALRAALKTRRYDVIHAHAPLGGIMLLFVMAVFGGYRRLIRSTIYTVQNCYQNYKLRNRLLMIPIFMCYRKLVVCSHSVRDSLPAHLKWLGKGRIHVVENAVDVERVDRVMSTVNRNGRTRFVVASVGRLIRIKNPFALLRAFPSANDVNARLVYVGEGNLRDAIGKVAESLSVADQVSCTGLLSRDEVYQTLSAADVFVSTSYGEGLPVAVLEAMACRRPVVLSDIPPHREIAEGTNCIALIPPDDVTGFAREIQRFRGMTVEERTAIGAQCRGIIDERFSLSAMHRKYGPIYEDLRSGRDVPRPVLRRLVPIAKSGA